MASSCSNSMIPGRTEVRKRLNDPKSSSSSLSSKSNQYERSRARDAYRKQISIFKAKFDSKLREYNRLDFDAKQEIRIYSKRQREICLKDYRENLQGLAKTTQRRNYKDLFLGEQESQIDFYDSNILEYELRLQSEIDTIIDNIRILNPDKTNLSKMDWFSTLARAKYSYEYELDNEIDPNSLLATPLKYQQPEDLDDNQSIRQQQQEFDPDLVDPELASELGSSAYVYRPFHYRRHNLYKNDEPEASTSSSYRYDWQKLYRPKSSASRARGDDDQQSTTSYAANDYDYEPFQPFSDEPYRCRRRRYPESQQDAEWQSQCSLYSYHRPAIQPGGPYFHTPQPGHSRFETDSNCPTYGYGGNDDNFDPTTTTHGELMAGLDYEYKPIIPSYLRTKNGANNKTNGKLFQYDDDHDDDDPYEPYDPYHGQQEQPEDSMINQHRYDNDEPQHFNHHNNDPPQQRGHSSNPDHNHRVIIDDDEDT